MNTYLCKSCDNTGKIKGHWFSLWRDTTCPVCNGNPEAYKKRIDKYVAESKRQRDLDIKTDYRHTNTYIDDNFLIKFLLINNLSENSVDYTHTKRHQTDDNNQTYSPSIVEDIPHTLHDHHSHISYDSGSSSCDISSF